MVKRACLRMRATSPSGMALVVVANSQSGLIAGEKVSRIYWDTMLFIYWLEDHPQFAKRVGEIRSRMNERGDQLVTAAFTFGEILAGVYSKASAELARQVR